MINNNFNTNNGVMVIDNNYYQQVSYSSGIAVPNDGIFTNKYDVGSDIYVTNRHQIDHAWETNNIYFIKDSTIVKTNFEGETLATSIALNNPNSICINQRMLVPLNPDDYIEESGCFVVGVESDVDNASSSSSSSKSDSSSSISNNVYLKIFDNQLNLISSITLDTTFAPGDKIHIIPEFTGSNTDYDTFEKFALIYLKKDSTYLWHIDYFNISESKVVPCKAIMSENYCLNGEYSYCFPMDAKTPAFIYNSKLWVMTSRIEPVIQESSLSSSSSSSVSSIDKDANYTREKIRVFDLSGTNPTGLLEKTVDPLKDMFGAGADNNVLSDMDINYSIPNFILATGGCQYSAWVVRYGNSGNFINKLDASIGTSVDFPKAIKCVQSPVSTFFYLLTEDNSDYFPAICDESTSSSSNSDISTSSSYSSRSSISPDGFSSSSSSTNSESSSTSVDERWIVSNPIKDLVPARMAYSDTGIIYIAGDFVPDNYATLANIRVRVYSTIDRINWTDITPYAELLANCSGTTFCSDLECDASGEIVTIMIKGDVSEALISQNYGVDWRFVCNIQSAVFTGMFSKRLAISKNGQKLAIRCGNVTNQYDEDVLFLNDSYGSGNWSSYNIGGNTPSGKGRAAMYSFVFIDEEDTNKIINTFNTFGGVGDSQYIIYSPDFGNSFIYNGPIVGSGSSHVFFAAVGNNINEMIMLQSPSGAVSDVTNIISSPTSTVIGSSNLYGQLVTNNNCSRAFISGYYPLAPSYTLLNRGIKNSNNTWTFNSLFGFDSTPCIPNPTVIAGANNLANVCVGNFYYANVSGYNNVYCVVTSR